MRPEFHELSVSAIEELTHEAVALTFEVPTELAAAYRFEAGQHLTVRLPNDEVRRSYSICSPVGADELRIGVKKLAGGAFSEVALGELKVGDQLAVMTPMGRFGQALAECRRPVLVAAGSGITPILSMAASSLAHDEITEVTVLDSNRTQREVMFADDLADLKDRYPTRLHLIHLLTREQQDSELLSGRLDLQRMARIRELLIPEADGWFLCGPFDFVTSVREALIEGEVDPGSVHTELFHAEALVVSPDAEQTSGAEAVAALAGLQTSFTVAPRETVLEALLRVRGDAPYACRGGVCGTCRARLLEGEVQMDTNWALEPEEVEQGYVLTCQSRACSDRLRLDYDG